MYAATKQQDMEGLGFYTPFPDLSQSYPTFSEDEFINGILDISSDSMETFMELGTIEEVKEEEESSETLPDLPQEIGVSGPWSLESSQSLIEEVENYLQQVEGGVTTLLAEAANHIVPGKINKMASAESIFKALTSGNVVVDWSDLQETYTTTIRGENGEDVIIFITPSLPSPCREENSCSPLSIDPSLSPRSTLSPLPGLSSPDPGFMSPGGSDLSESDCEWSPSPGSATSSSAPSRRKYQRKIRSGPPCAAPYPKEKAARKKAQNRSAAYKYREKKRQEQDSVDDELSALWERNAILKKRLNDKEVELRCLKKLMAETGLTL